MPQDSLLKPHAKGERSRTRSPGNQTFTSRFCLRGKCETRFNGLLQNIYERRRSGQPDPSLLIYVTENQGICLYDLAHHVEIHRIISI